MSRRVQHFKKAVTVLCTATVLQFSCLPDNYFRLAGQRAAVSLADTILEVTIAQVALALGLPVDGITDGENGDTTQ
jgi:hypothetical protein